MMYATVKKTLVSFSDDLTICMKATTARSNIRSFTTSEEISGSRESRDGEILTLAAGNMVIILAWTLNFSRYLFADANCTVWLGQCWNQALMFQVPRSPCTWMMTACECTWSPSPSWPMPSTGDAFIAKIQVTFYLIYTSAPSCFCSDFIKSHLCIHHIYPQAPKSTSLPVPAFSPSLFYSNPPLSSCSVSSRSMEAPPSTTSIPFSSALGTFRSFSTGKEIMMMMMKENQNAYFFFRR